MKNKPKITHILADGREVDSLKGYLVKRTPETEALYLLLANYGREEEEE